ncbi:Uncharacterized protein BM_BM1029 [Brugia malayi]|uniref:Bm1029 n=3 Tax=Brugia TaxID=6278 RepID=A0A0I9NAP3_BRUMA|nr:Uncharacterized protein BM_BM1029 [Brugia malayi]CTP81688.1 Bm1029 [Brugia malayi]VDO31073.1 unnamed protein product [Brugia timori]VIO96340.1 Uncharacterized protein BM_BM1029 [Brugia malayi]
MITNSYLQFTDKSWLLYVLFILVCMILTGRKATKCFSNQFDKIQEENCGPAGFCFIMRKDSSFRKGNFTVRGCDHTFLCEMISETEGVEKVTFTKGIINYCMSNVQYMNFFGYFCCCYGDDWCNKNSKVEEISEEHILKDLIQGISTGEKWQRLQEIAEKYDVIVAT